MNEKLYAIRLFGITKLRRIKELFWALKPKNWKFWIVKPATLNVQYNDARELYLHTSMKVLCDFYHQQLETGHICWECEEEHKKVWAEIEAIAYWWEHVYPTYEPICDKPEYIKAPHFLSGYSNKEQHKEYWDWLDDVAKQEVLNEETEQQMVERLSKIYKFLWD